MSKKLSKQKLNDIITYGIVIAAFVIMQILINAGEISSLFQGLMVPLCTYIILAISLNLVVGILGELSLGHAGFMCVGAFTSSFFSKAMQDTITNSTVRFLLALLIGIITAAIFGIIIGIPVLRLNGDYLAIVTLAFGEIIKNLVNVLFIGKDSKGFHFSTKDAVSLNMEPDGKIILNGPQGITGTPNDSTFFIGFILILVTLFIVLNLIHSRDGRAIMAIRDNRIAAESIGYQYYKIQTYDIYNISSNGRCSRCSLRTQPLKPHSQHKQLRLQYVNKHPCIRSSRRYRKYQRLYHSRCRAYTSS